MSNARGYPPYPPRGKKPHGPSRCRFYTGPPSSRRSRDQDGRDLLYDLHTITGQSEGTHTHATQTKRREHRTGPAVREAEPERQSQEERGREGKTPRGEDGRNVYREGPARKRETRSREETSEDAAFKRYRTSWHEEEEEEEEEEIEGWRRRKR
ncbi:Uncharacterized protein DBV15_05707 [Temnothorax longispinosus]|uniref:Uncharacterized protein n=1 Tax=Temnothorax longispinosus TaxID=300112 RepID=A0A4S2JDJ2_9HYME|nr:Uncharacterized protein DBV15_05707 [Temnothorax longispinosus]